MVALVIPVAGSTPEYRFYPDSEESSKGVVCAAVIAALRWAEELRGTNGNS